MDLPSPTFSFLIPSFRDGSQLECRVYLPDQLQNIQPGTWTPRAAIVAHPYATLGGCYDDPVVSFISGELLHSGYLVGTFNFRGAGGSQGRTSWTAKPELQDYVSFYGFMLQYLQHLQHDLYYTTGNSSVSGAGNDDGDAGIQLILGGYSFGSLVASHAPEVDVILDLFRSDTASVSKPVHEIGEIARKIAVATMRRLDPANVDRGAADDSDCRPRASPSHSHSISIAYLLVSPLLPPVSQFLTCFSTLSLDVGTGESVQGGLDQLSTHSTLALYGDRDTFTSSRNLQRWSAEMARVPQSRFQSCEIAGAGHFWREDGVENRARSRLREWLRQIRLKML